MANKDFNPGYNWHRGNQRSQKSSSGRGGKSSGPQYDGGLSPVGKVILGGVAIYVAGSLGLGWITDTIDNAKTAIEIKNEVKEAAKREKADNKQSEKAEKKLEGEINSQGFTEKFDIDEFELEAGDVADILSEIEEAYTVNKGIEIKEENIIYLEPEAVANSANYQASIMERMKYYSEPVAFAVIFKDLSEKEMEKKYEDVKYVRDNNMRWSNQAFNTVHLQGLMGTPTYEDMTIVITFYYNDKAE